MATNRKAKVEAQHVGCFPLSTVNLTPKAAAKWLEQDAPGWHELIDLSLTHADKDERRALGTLTYYLGEVVQAAFRAVRTGKPVKLERDEDASTVESLALVVRAASRIGEHPPDVLLDIGPQLGAIASAIVRHARQELTDRNKRWKAEREERHQKRLATDPAYRAHAEAVERFREAGEEAAAAGRAAERAA